MNSYEVRSRFDGYQWIGEFRRVNRADFETVQSDGRIERYNSSIEAENAALRAIVSIINNDIISWMDCPKTPTQRAKRAFNSIFVKGKQIPVEVK